jgi:hypothetical protein
MNRTLLAIVLSAVAAAVAPVVTVDDRFTIAVIPDTQNYVDFRRQRTNGYPFDASALFFEQMAYIARNAESAGGDIAFAISVGDIWQHASLLMDPAHEARGFKRVGGGLPTNELFTIELPLVRKGYEIIAGTVPFAVVPGNHDYDATWTDARFPPSAVIKSPADLGTSYAGGLTTFKSVFSDRSAFFADKSWYVAAHDDGADSAQIFSGGSHRFLHIGLQFDPTDTSLDWAASVIRRHPGLPTIVTTHNYLDPSGERRAGPIIDNHAIDPAHNTPQMVWEKFISQHDQIFMVLCGHRTAQALRTEPNRFGHSVHQILSDYQERWQTAKAAGVEEKGMGIGDGWMRLMTFDMSASAPMIQVRTYSTHFKKFSTELPEYASWYKPGEKPTLTDDEFHAQDDFRIALTDFRERFGKISPD